MGIRLVSLPDLRSDKEGVYGASNDQSAYSYVDFLEEKEDIKYDDHTNSFFELIPIQSFNIDDLMVNLSLDNDLINPIIEKSPVSSDVLKEIDKDNNNFSTYDPKSILGEDLYNDLYNEWAYLNSDDSDELYNELNKRFLNRADEIEEDSKYSTLNYCYNDLTDKYEYILQSRDWLLDNWVHLSKDVFYDRIPVNVLSDIEESLKKAKDPEDLTSSVSNVCCDLLYSYLKHRDKNIKSERYESHILEDYDKVLLERKKKITESIFKLFQRFLWQYVKEKDFAVTGSKQIFGKKYLTIQHLPSGTILYIKTHAPFTLRYEARAVRVLDNTILNYRDTDMTLSDLQKADEIVCNWFKDIITAYEQYIKNLSNTEIKDLVPYAKIWINLVRLTLDIAPHTLSRLDLNLNIPDGKLKRDGFRDVSIHDLLILWFETIYKFDSANNILRGVRGVNYDSFYFKPRIKNHPHVSVYNKNEDTRTKLEGSKDTDREGLIDTITDVAAEITLIQQELRNIEQKVKDRDPGMIAYQRRLYGKLSYLQKLLPILKKQKEQLEDSLKDKKKIYRIELRFFKDALYRAIQKGTNNELKTANIKAICSLDKDILKKIFFTALKEMADNYDPLKYVYRTSDDQDEIKQYYRDISSGFGISPVEILKFIADNDRKATIDELVEHGFTYPRNVYKKGEEVFYLNKGDKYTIPEGERASVSFDEESDKVKIVRETKELIGTEEKKVSKSTISDKLKILQGYGLITRCKGHIAITDEGLHFLGRGVERSITLVYRVLVLGGILDGGYGNTKKEINQSYANSPSDYVLKFEIFNGHDRDPPPDT